MNPGSDYSGRWSISDGCPDQSPNQYRSGNSYGQVNRYRFLQPIHTDQWWNWILVRIIGSGVFQKFVLWSAYFDRPSLTVLGQPWITTIRLAPQSLGHTLLSNFALVTLSEFHQYFKNWRRFNKKSHAKSGAVVIQTFLLTLRSKASVFQGEGVIRHVKKGSCL